LGDDARAFGLAAGTLALLGRRHAGDASALVQLATLTDAELLGLPELDELRRRSHSAVSAAATGQAPSADERAVFLDQHPRGSEARAFARRHLDACRMPATPPRVDLEAWLLLQQEIGVGAS
jgi:hypothetical protein